MITVRSMALAAMMLALPALMSPDDRKELQGGHSVLERVSSMSDQIEFHRHFQIWLHSVSHRQLLLRSNRSDTEATRVDALFKDVAMLKIPTSFMGLVITEAPKREAIGLDPQLDSKMISTRKVFIIRGDDFSGYMAAAAVFWHEDEGRHFDKSYFQQFIYIAASLSLLGAFGLLGSLISCGERPCSRSHDTGRQEPDHRRQLRHPRPHDPARRARS